MWFVAENLRRADNMPPVRPTDDAGAAGAIETQTRPIRDQHDGRAGQMSGGCGHAGARQRSGAAAAARGSCEGSWVHGPGS